MQNNITYCLMLQTNAKTTKRYRAMTISHSGPRSPPEGRWKAEGR